MTLTPISWLPAYTVVDPPKPGRAVLGCRCGRAIDSSDMRITRDPDTGGVGRVVCAGCADNRSW